MSSEATVIKWISHDLEGRAPSIAVDLREQSGLLARSGARLLDATPTQYPGYGNVLWSVGESIKSALAVV